MMFEHKSVLLEETVECLGVLPDGIYVDGTLGGGGHALEVVKRLSEKGRFVGIDQDMDAIRAASERLAGYGYGSVCLEMGTGTLPGQALLPQGRSPSEASSSDCGGNSRITLVHGNYASFSEICGFLGIREVNGICLDLGVSGYQLDAAERGFTYRDANAPLDMRMDQGGGLTAADVVNTYSESELCRVIRDYGEDKFAKNIAKHIVRAREEKPLATAGDLTAAIKAAIPMKLRVKGGHPAKRTFQAIRIEVNQELAVLERSIDGMIASLAPGGRLCIITFHSLEDRIVKAKFRENETPCICPPEFPVCICGRVSRGRVLTRRPILPSKEELEINNRSRTAKLRVFERG